MWELKGFFISNYDYGIFITGNNATLIFNEIRNINKCAVTATEINNKIESTYIYNTKIGMQIKGNRIFLTGNSVKDC